MKMPKLFSQTGILLLIVSIMACKEETPIHSVTSSDGVEVHFTNKGKGTPTIVFIHGWSNQRTIWKDQVNHFSKKYQTIAVDLPGSGESGNNRAEWSIQAFGKDVVAVIDQLEIDEVVLVGFSMGTAVVIEAAIQIPDKTLGVVLVDGLQNPEEVVPPEAMAAIDSVFFDLLNNMSNEKLVNLGFYKHNQESAFNRLLPMYEGVSRVGWKESLHATMQWGNADCIPALKELKAPLIAINSDMKPTNSAAFNSYVPSYKLKTMTDVGHLVFWDNPDEFNRLLEESIQEFLAMKK